MAQLPFLLLEKKRTQNGVDLLVWGSSKVLLEALNEVALPCQKVPNVEVQHLEVQMGLPCLKVPNVEVQHLEVQMGLLRKAGVK